MFTSLNSNFVSSASDELLFTDDVYLYNQQIYQKFPCDSYYWQYRDVTRFNTTVPNAIEFQYITPYYKFLLFFTRRL